LIFKTLTSTFIAGIDMWSKRKLSNYEPVVRSPRSRRDLSRDDQGFRSNLRVIEQNPKHVVSSAKTFKSEAMVEGESARVPTSRRSPDVESWINKRGHALSFAGLFLFTFLVYFRPYELFPSLSWLSKSAFVVALITVAVFVPTQLGLENKITAMPREVKLVLALMLTGILSIPLAVDPPRALESFIEYFKVVVMFIVMVNVVRTERRLRGLILLVLLASCIMSLAALNDYRLGNLALQGRRIAGLIGGLFGNPNDLALHLVTMVPISLALMLSSRRLLRKGFYLACSLILMFGMVATFSRGGFLGFVCVMAFLVWKLARRNRAIFAAVALIAVIGTAAVAPSSYRSRLATTNDASAVARTNDLKRSILVAARHPVFGVGMDNYMIYSNTNKTTHNAYTQVAAEMGFVALLIYLAFLITPFSRLRTIEQSMRNAKPRPNAYYLAVGLQASLVAYMVVSFFASVAYLWYAYYLVAYSICMRRIYSSDEIELLPKTRTDFNRTQLNAERSSLHQVDDALAEGN
jgi:putative inorganic carbon (hco3(-)) transporter